VTAFHETARFPTSISMGAVGGPRFSTTITTLSGGTEQRNINWKQARGEWDVSHGLKTEQQVDELLAFFQKVIERRGPAPLRFELVAVEAAQGGQHQRGEEHVRAGHGARTELERRPIAGRAPERQA